MKGGNYMGYTRAAIHDRCVKALETPHLFYREDFINYTGRCTDTDEFYTEVVAEFVCDHIDVFLQDIPQITRQPTYKTPTHKGVFNPNSKRKEEITAMMMFNFCDKDGGRYDFIGKIIDYQTPLKNKQTDEVGKIDLLAYDGISLRLLELKKPDTDETMLRCVMEGFTYLETVDKEKLIENFGLPSETKVVACPFVFADSGPHLEMLEDRPHLKRLMALLNSKPYYIKQDNGLFTVTEE